MHKNIEFQNDFNFQKTISFLNEISIPIYYKNVEEDTFLPGLKIESGGIIVDTGKLKYPGDILHEAGHIAVVPLAERHTLNAATIAKRPQRDAEEMMAIAWSYAACVHLQMDATFVFHDEGYKGGGSNIAENFSEGRYFGVPMLQWTGMAFEQIKMDTPDVPVYPKMLKWLRE